MVVVVVVVTSLHPGQLGVAFAGRWNGHIPVVVVVVGVVVVVVVV